MRLYPFRILLALFFILFTQSLYSAYDKGDNYTVIVSLDGFRQDYPQIHNTPNLDKIKKSGVYATMRPSYPASTFPNHYTLITGLVPDHHGIINNSFWDRENNIQYNMGDSITRNNPMYYKGETIWATAQRQGVKTGSVYWVGSDIPINNTFPYLYKVWAEKPRLNFAQRVDTTLAWLNRSEQERPRLITLYLDEPDGTGHRAGPKGVETGDMVLKIDSLIGKLIDGIAMLPFSEKVNLIITSDHGMTDVSSERYYKIDDSLKPSWYERAIGANPTSIYARSHNVDSIVFALSKLKHLKVYKKKDIPKSLNYGTNNDVGDVIVVADCGWQFGYKAGSAKGAHGYDPKNKDMSVIFYAYGPDFKKNYKGKTFDNTAIYPLLCHLLGVKPSANDGNVRQYEQFIIK